MEDRQSIHIRILPFPPVVLETNRFFNNRFYIADGLSIPAGMYQRVSSLMVTRLEAQAAKDQPRDRREKIQGLIELAKSFPQSLEEETANTEFIDLSPY